MRGIVLRLLVLGVLAGPVLLLMLLTELRPLVAEETRATPEAAHAARALARRVRAVSEDPDADPRVAVSLEQLNGAIAFGARLVPGLRGRAEIVPEGLRLALSLPVPLLPRLGWINAEAVVPPFAGEAALGSARVGHLPLPPRLTRSAAVLAADLLLGSGTGRRLLEGVPGLETAGDGVVLTVALDSEGRRSLTRRVAALVRGEEMPLAEEIDAYHGALREALEAGQLDDRGSFLPYLAFILGEADRRAEPGGEARAFTAALFALSKLCGAREFRLVVGRLAESATAADTRSWTRDCRRVTFGGRIDLRRHFITAAAIKAASTVQVSFAIGEFKELFDAGRAAGGFDFTDIVANTSGIFFAETVMAAPREAWPALSARLRSEADVLADLAGVPGKLERAEFEARFGDVDSPAYAAMVRLIEARVAALAFHAALPGG